MDIYPAEIAAARAAAWLADEESTAGDAVLAQITRIPDCVFTPHVVAVIAARLSSKCAALSLERREVAQAYLDDLHDDMRG